MLYFMKTVWIHVKNWNQNKQNFMFCFSFFNILIYFSYIHVGERHHERHHVQPTADQQWEDLIELGSPVHHLISRSQCAELHHQLGRWPGSQRHSTPLQVRKEHACRLSGAQNTVIRQKRFSVLIWSNCFFIWLFSFNTFSFVKPENAYLCGLFFYLLLWNVFWTQKCSSVFETWPLTLSVNHLDHSPMPF